jgi:glycosyltransferase involved in cell wall biosynthesis
MASSAPENGQATGLPISVCVPTMRWETVGSTIRAIRAQTWTDWEIIVLGQGPREPLEAAVSTAASGDQRVRYVQLERRGLSIARNAALETAAGSVIAFTDDDCEPRPDWLATVARAFLDDPRLGVVGGAVLSPESLGYLKTCPTCSPTEGLYDPIAEPGHPPDGWDWIGANFAVRRHVTRQLGGFDECLGLGSEFPAAEDTDYKLRLEAAGVRMLTTPRAAVLHTYGVRRGLAVFRSQKNYATGNGAMAAKLTLLGDKRGVQWLDETRKDCHGAPPRLARSLRRLHYFSAAYERCLRDYKVVGGFLRRAG